MYSCYSSSSFFLEYPGIFLGGELDEEDNTHGKKITDLVSTPPPAKEKRKLMFKKVIYTSQC